MLRIRKVGWRHFLAALASAGAVVGCGASATDDEGDDQPTYGGPECGQPVAGERLVVKDVLRGDDGSLRLETRTLYDQQFEASCRFARAADGVERCLPFGVETIYAIETRYRDAGCTEPIWIGRGDIDAWWKAPEPERYAYEAVSDGNCHVWYRVYEIVENLGVVETTFTGEPGACSVNPTAETSRAYAPGPEIPPESFVASTLDATGNRLKLTQRLAADGARLQVVSPPFDEERGTICSAELVPDGALRCVPDTLTLNTVYTDAACSEAITLVPPLSSCPAAPPFDTPPFDTRQWYAAQLDPGTDACLPIGRVFELGDPSQATVPAATYSRDFAGACSSTPNDSGLDYLPLGEELPTSDFAALSWEQTQCDSAGTAGTRLTRYSMVDEEGLVLPGGKFFDPQLDHPCDASYADDGVIRCLPVPSAAIPIDPLPFVDAACTRPMVRLSKECGPLGQLHRYAVEANPSEGAGALGFSLSVYDLVGPELSSGYSLDPSAGCTPFSEGDSSSAYKELGDPLPAAMFVAFSLEP